MPSKKDLGEMVGREQKILLEIHKSGGTLDEYAVRDIGDACALLHHQALNILGCTGKQQSTKHTCVLLLEDTYMLSRNLDV